MGSFAEASAIEERALTFPEQARAVRIKDHATYEKACTVLTGIKALLREIDDTFDPHIANAHKAHKALCDEKKKAGAPLLEAESIIKDNLLVYDAEMARAARAEDERLRKEARDREEERRLQQAISLEDRGHVEQAARVLERPMLVPVPAPVAKEPPKVSGVTFRAAPPQARVVDMDLLVEFLGTKEGRPFRGLIEVNQAKLNQLAKGLDGKVDLPGVEVTVGGRSVAASAGRR